MAGTFMPYERAGQGGGEGIGGHRKVPVTQEHQGRGGARRARSPAAGTAHFVNDKPR
jgi:hypothetical protein